ncbi:MAG: class I SAM-dependent methyltransferase [Anaerolineae bacterium]|nr:MAG: class I SAM-dependent methyltransferase [Anaerolineae bacterium]
MPRPDHFGFLAPIYDRVIITAIQAERLKALLQLPVDGPLLDVGGGTGRVAQVLADQASHIVVLDESLGMLRQAQEKRLPTACARSEQLPFPDGAIPRILMVDAFHHLGDQDHAVAELMRVLAPGGRMVIEESNIEHGAVKLVALAERLALMRSRFRTPREVQRLFQATGSQVGISRDGPSFWVVVEKRR